MVAVDRTLSAGNGTARDSASWAGAGPLALVLLAAALRVPTLAEQSFWLDEAYTERLVHMSFGGMLSTIPATESTPPGYYVLAWAWTRLFGYSEFGIRSLSALAGILTVPVVYAIGTRLGGRRAGFIAGALAACSPLMVWFSQEARAYALATLLSTVTVLCVLRLIDTERRRWVLGWALSAALGVATHYFVAFVVAPEAVWLLWRHRRDRRVLGAAAFVLAVAGALVPLALAQRGTGHADYISQGSLGTRVLQVPKQFLIGYASPLQLVSSVVAAALALAGGLTALAGSLGRVKLPLAIGAAGVLIPVLLALVGVDFLNTRNVLPALPPLLVVLGTGFAASRPAAVLGLALALVLVTVVLLVDTDPRYQRDDWRGVSHTLGVADENRVIVVSPASGLLVLALYQSGLRPLDGPATVSEIDLVGLPDNVPGQGIGTLPRPTGTPQLPPGFKLTDAAYARTYTVLRFRARTAIAVTRISLAADELKPGAPGIVLQSRR